ncbi:MAG: class I SAM-dependent RNA methyltransferase [Desulfovibrio sp.]|nr:class I SAM-dependent RNA methyltransferase [Desulfovibrio sp.]
MNLIHELRITELAHNGAGIGFIPGAGRGKAVFVPGALPGQVVSARPVKDSKNWLAAQLVAVTCEPDNLAEPICGHASECGGCPWQRLPYERQLFFRQRLAQQALARIGGMVWDDILRAWQPARPAPLLRNFRNKLELAFGRDRSGNLALGFRSRASHAVCGVSDCALLDEAGRGLVDAAVEFAKAARLAPAYWRHLVLRRSRGLADPSLRWHCLLITRPDRKARRVAAALGERLLARQAGSFVHEERTSSSQLARGERRVLCLDRAGRENAAAAILALELGGRLFEFDAASFFQVNDLAAQELAACLPYSGESGPLLDLFCGSGAPGQLLSGRHAAGLGLELDSRAVAMARRNAGRNGLSGWRYRAGPALRALGELKRGKWPAVLLDPPRQGVGSEAMARLLALEPREITYISCDPATLARDAGMFGPEWRLDSLRPVDMFPHTPHLECIAHWRRKAG